MHAMAVIPDYFHLQHLAHAQQCPYNFQKLTTPLSLGSSSARFSVFQRFSKKVTHKFPVCGLWPELALGNIFVV
jgi:hypothetical protein